MGNIFYEYVFKISELHRDFLDVNPLNACFAMLYWFTSDLRRLLTVRDPGKVDFLAKGVRPKASD